MVICQSSGDEKEIAIEESSFDASHERFASIDLLLFMRSINPITYRRNALCCGKSRLLPAGWVALKFTRKRRILEKQTNLSLGFALSALRSNTEK